MEYRIHAPGLGYHAMDRVAAFGAAARLAMQAPRIKDLRFAQLNRLILQPQDALCDVLICADDGNNGWTPRLWAVYAQFDAQNEGAYVRDPSQPIGLGAWRSGDRLWMLHLVAPTGYSVDLHLLLQKLFAGRTARSLSPRSHLLGQRLVIWRGKGCTTTGARRFWADRPIPA